MDNWSEWKEILTTLFRMAHTLKFMSCLLLKVLLGTLDHSWPWKTLNKVNTMGKNIGG